MVLRSSPVLRRLGLLALIVAVLLPFSALPTSGQALSCTEEIFDTILLPNPFLPIPGLLFEARVMVDTKFDPGCYSVGDNRVNQDNAAPIAIYCEPGGIAFWTIDITSRGTPAFFVTHEAIESLPDTLAQNTLLTEHGGFRLYVLTSGELQVNGPPDWEGKEYVFIWPGCERPAAS